MGYEIERKFLVKGDFKSHVYKSYIIKQGYLSVSGSNLVRVRTKGEKAYVTIKTAALEDSIVRNEWEYEIPFADAEEMLELCEGIISKTRYLVDVAKHTYEVDEFYGDNEGLLVAEIELDEENESFDKPDWLGEEVSGNIRYYNSFLSIHPFNTWNSDKK